MSRITEAIAIRDRVVPFVQSNGIVENVGSGVSVVIATIGELRFSLRTPFTRLPLFCPASYTDAIVLQRTRVNLPYGLDIWCGKKVFSLQWDHDGTIDLMSFRRGPWEQKIPN